ncbi:MAG: pilus assembly protein TadG-related protein [Myxococcota bacterium]
MRVYRRGNIALTVALSAAVIFSFAAVAIDLGYARVVRVELQNGADAVAHAAATKIDGTAEGLTAATASGHGVAGRNEAAGAPVTLAEDGLQLGIWDHDTAAFTASNDPMLVNAARAETRVPTLQTFFARIFGRTSVEVGARSVVTREHGGASEVECFLPLAIPDCLIDYHGGIASLADVTLGLSPSGIDGIGWACANCGPSAEGSRTQIEDCESMGPASVGDPVGLQNGVATSPMTALADAVTSSATRWRTSTWGTLPSPLVGSAVPSSAFGNTFEAAIIVFDGTAGGYCSGDGGAFNGTATITGFMWASVYDVRTSGGGDDPTIRMRLDPLGEHLVGTEGGGPDWGVLGTSPPRLVSSQ